MFAKGDMVRVKAGSPRYCSPGSTMGPYETDYGKGFVVHGVRGYNNVVCCMLSGTNAINAEYLEPWNDNEEWNGYQWVAKSTSVDESEPLVPDMVIIGGVRYVRAKDVCIPKKTNAEIAEALFKARMSHGRVQYSSDNMQASVRITHVRRTGNIVTVDFDAGE